jgi:hypothetical protein
LFINLGSEPSAGTHDSEYFAGGGIIVLEEAPKGLYIRLSKLRKGKVILLRHGGLEMMK